MPRSRTSPYWLNLAARRAAGLCECGEVPETGKKQCRGCLDRYNAYAFQRMNERREKGLCYNCGKIAKLGTVRCEECLEKSRVAEHRRSPQRHIKDALSRKQLRIAAIKAYGGMCACCNETEYAFLCIDHINGGGRVHRDKIGGSGDKIFRWLRVNNYPEGFQVLCANCNMAKGANGTCPHKGKIL